MQKLSLERREEELEKRLAGVKDIMTIEEASWYTGMSKSYLYKLTSKNMIPYYKPLGNPYYKPLGKMVYFEKSELDNWLRQNHVSSMARLEAKATKYGLNHARL